VLVSRQVHLLGDFHHPVRGEALALRVKKNVQPDPDLHVVAAGSLLEFALGGISFPVGRIEFMEMRPFTFIECIFTSHWHGYSTIPSG
jgi:hypothetical protein